MKNNHRPSVMNDIWRDQCIKMWENIVSQHEGEVQDVSSMLCSCDSYKEAALEAVSDFFGEDLAPQSYCFACEETNAQKSYVGIGWENCQNFCPVDWGAADCGCGGESSSYRAWVYAMSPETALKYAKEVLCVIKKTWKTTEQFLLDRGLNPDVKAGYETKAGYEKEENGLC